MDYASSVIMNATPVTLAAAVGVLSGLYWLTKKKNKAAEEEG